MNDQIKGKIESFFADQQPLELVDVRIGGSGGKMLLQVLLDKEGGISLDDLTGVNRQLSKALDEWDLLSGAYMLEVSSAGVERPLVKMDDFKRFSGRKAKLLMHSPLEENRKKVTGIIKEIIGDKIIIEAEDQAFEIQYENIKKANLVFEM